MAFHLRPPLTITILLFILMTSLALASAQDETPAEVTPEVTEEPIATVEQPAPEITDEPAAAPTEEPATPEASEEPQPGGEQPAPEEPEQTAEPENAQEPEQTTEPDGPQEPTQEVISAPPVFEVAGVFSVEAGQSVSIPFAVYDEQGAVVITEILSAAGAQTALEIAAPIQTSPPFATTGTITYTAAAGFSGPDVLTLTAVDGAGTSASTAIQIDVLAAPVVEVTEEATAEATQEPTEEAAPTVERIISYDPNASEESIQAVLAALNATEVSRIPQIGSMKVLIPAALTTSQAMNAIQGSNAAIAAGVSAIEENIEYHIDFIPNDPVFQSDQWALFFTFTHAAWDYAKQDGAGVSVAVLDTGVDLQHPDLIGQIDVGKGWDFVNDDSNPDDDDVDDGHGTHVAGIIAAKTNNGQYMAGIAYKSKIIPVKVCFGSGGCPIYEIAAGIVHAVDKGAQVINLSLSGSTISTTIQGAVQYAITRNVTVVAAAGNDGDTSYNYPASYPGVISVTAHDINGANLSFANQNDRITVAAPGVSVFSLATMEEGGASYWTGTSTATAHVSGIAALLYADNVARTPARIREALICGAIDAGAAGYDNVFGYGYVQADWAFNWRENSANCKITQPNDLIQSATSITRVPYTVMQPVHSRSVTAEAGDPTDCFSPAVQTLWYRFVPPANDRYQITTYGSSYNTVLAAYQGAPGNWTLKGCAGAWFDPGAYLTLDMKKGQTYYIAVMTFSASPVNDQIMRLDIRPGMSTPNKDYQENDSRMSYAGGWQQMSAAGASGGKVMQTFNNLGYATFTFRGSSFQLFRVVGPDQGSMEVWLNNVLVTTLNNRAAFQTVQGVTLVVPGSSTGLWNTVTIRRAAGGMAGPIAIDRIRPADLASKLITLKTDDRETTKFSLTGLWMPLPSIGAFKNTMTQTTAQNATLEARVKGSTIVVYRNIGPGFGSMNVYVDGTFWGTIDNTFGSSALSVPIAITDLTPVEHVIRLQNNASSVIEFDAIEGLMTSALPINKLSDLGSKSVLRSGVWTTVNTPAAYADKTYLTTGTSSRMDFNFTGDTFCLAFVRRADGGTIDLYVDNMNVPYEQISTHIDPNFWGVNYFWPPDALAGSIQRYCTGAAFPDGTHHVRLMMTNNNPVELDYIYPGRYGIITAQSGLVQENDPRIVHTPWVYSLTSENTASLWKRITMKSLGGAKPQGGYLKRTTFATPPPPFPALRFFISGSGFILYTSSGPLAGSMTILVCEPAAPTCSSPNIILGGVNQGTFLDLNTLNRARPFAYAVTGLGPGVHEILIYAQGSPGQYVDFDGVRVFP